MNYTWVGESKLGVPLVGSRKKVPLFDAVRFQKRHHGETIVRLFGVGDFVHLRSPNQGLPYIGRIINLWEAHDKLKMLTIQWCYRPSDVPTASRIAEMSFEDSELLLTDHFDNNEVGSILETVRVRFDARASTRAVVSQLFTDELDAKYGWGDALLPRSDLSKDIKFDYRCCKKYQVAKDILKRLNDADLDAVCEQLYSDETKMTANPLSAIRLRELCCAANDSRPDQATRALSGFDAVALCTVFHEEGLDTLHANNVGEMQHHPSGAMSGMNPSEGLGMVQKTPTMVCSPGKGPKRLRMSSSRSNTPSYPPHYDKPTVSETPLASSLPQASWSCSVQ